jgi:hypothetical protein
MEKIKVWALQKMKVDFTTKINNMKKIDSIFIFNCIFILLISLISNFILSFANDKTSSVFSLRNFYLISFIIILILKNKISFYFLILFSLTYWINFIFFNESASFSNQILYFTYNINEVFIENNTLKKIILNLPFIVNIMISLKILFYYKKFHLKNF